MVTSGYSTPSEDLSNLIFFYLRKYLWDLQKRNPGAAFSQKAELGRHAIPDCTYQPVLRAFGGEAVDIFDCARTVLYQYLTLDWGSELVWQQFMVGQDRVFVDFACEANAPPAASTRRPDRLSDESVRAAAWVAQIANEVPQPQEELALGLVTLK